MKDISGERVGILFYDSLYLEGSPGDPVLDQHYSVDSTRSQVSSLQVTDSFSGSDCSDHSLHKHL